MAEEKVNMIFSVSFMSLENEDFPRIRREHFERVTLTPGKAQRLLDILHRTLKYVMDANEENEANESKKGIELCPRRKS